MLILILGLVTFHFGFIWVQINHQGIIKRTIWDRLLGKEGEYYGFKEIKNIHWTKGYKSGHPHHFRIHLKNSNEKVCIDISKHSNLKEFLKILLQLDIDLYYDFSKDELQHQIDLVKKELKSDLKA